MKEPRRTCFSPWPLWALAGVGVLLAAAAVGAHQAHLEKAPSYRVEPTPELVARGKEIFQFRCRICHAAKSTEWRQGPGLAGLYRRERTPAMKHPVTDANLRDHIQQGGGEMPAFPEIDGPEMRALIAFLKTL
jgi:mono/diheme cytochrome c family protein